MRTLIALLATLAASGASAREPSPDDLVYRALSVRHPEPVCAEVEALTPTPVATLLKMVDEASQPPWVPMRAADCLITRHHAEVRDRLDVWVTDPSLRGLGIWLENRLDALPVDVAREIAAKALAEGPDPVGTRTRLRRLAQPELRALAEPGAVGPATPTTPTTPTTPATPTGAEGGVE